MGCFKDIAPSELVDAPSSCLEKPWLDKDGLTHAMLIAWFGRRDLQDAFDLSEADGRRDFRAWYVAERGGGSAGKRLMRRALAVVRAAPADRSIQDAAPGVNLVGYAQGVLGMGEHVRMSATAMTAAEVPCGIVNFTLGLGPRRQRLPAELRTIRSARHRCNLFHINADQMLRAYLHFGERFFGNRYNIGYWAWELAHWPDEWRGAIGTVDEIWAPSRFVQDAIAPVTDKPVEWMPLCVEIPAVGKIARSEFGVADADYVFVFTFDCHSYIERKNPDAVVRAFRMAFPEDRHARLIIKAMNTEVCADRWRALIEEARSDARVKLIDETWPRAKVLSLLDLSDAYVSLHRSEGFGRGPAEAMLLGKPVIVTDYSGTTDFCRDDNALLVDYGLVAIPPDSYVGSAGQVWADPSVECAAKHMRALFDDRTLGPRVGVKGHQTISEEFSAAAIGRRYRSRLTQLGMIDGGM
jgi:glycosyltransferase involved in cell wall biosynthesis